ncbi:MAG: hypothetical protein R2718_06970 [Solirubrobacterales bacterium]
MTELGAPRAPARLVLGLLAVVQGVDGFYALLAPRSFYEDFPAGRGWVEALPAYSEHLVRDVGGLFLATAVVLGAAAIWLERRLVLVALVSFLAFSIPHTTYHLFNLGGISTGDAIAEAVLLLLTVVAPVALLVAMLMHRPGRA